MLSVTVLTIFEWEATFTFIEMALCVGFLFACGQVVSLKRAAVSETGRWRVLGAGLWILIVTTTGRYLTLEIPNNLSLWMHTPFHLPQNHPLWLAPHYVWYVGSAVVPPSLSGPALYPAIRLVGAPRSLWRVLVMGLLGAIAGSAAVMLAFLLTAQVDWYGRYQDAPLWVQWSTSIGLWQAGMAWVMADWFCANHTDE